MILGLDLSTTATGICLLDAGDPDLMLHEPAGDGFDRAVDVVRRVQLEVGLRQPRLVAMEAVWMPRIPGAGAAVIPLAEMAGAVKLALRQLGVPWVSLEPAHWRRVTFGKAIKKKEVREAAAAMGVRHRSLDAIEAWGIAEAARRLREEPLLHRGRAPRRSAYSKRTSNAPSLFDPPE